MRDSSHPLEACLQQQAALNAESQAGLANDAANQSKISS
jgi:hypothetical protein